MLAGTAKSEFRRQANFLPASPITASDGVPPPIATLPRGG